LRADVTAARAFRHAALVRGAPSPLTGAMPGAAPEPDAVGGFAIVDWMKFA
jgi:hypothetical protein